MYLQISLGTGGHVDTDLQGQVCSSAPKQRIYDVIDDTEYLWQVPCLACCCASLLDKESTLPMLSHGTTWLG